MKVFYRPEQVSSNQAAYSPSAYKPKLVIEDWIAQGIVLPQDIQSFEPVSRTDFKRVHNHSLQQVSDGSPMLASYSKQG